MTQHPHYTHTANGCPKCKARANNISHLSRRLGNGTAIFESSCIQCGWNKSTTLTTAVISRLRAAAAATITTPQNNKSIAASPTTEERTTVMEQAPALSPHKGKKKKICLECNRLMVIVARGYCGKCYHHLVKKKTRPAVAQVPAQPKALPVVLETALAADSQMPCAQRVETPPCQVNHPQHYTNHPSGVECIQITEHMGFNLGNALKYLWRADEKGAALQDLEKAVWYIQREIARRGATA